MSLKEKYKSTTPISAANAVAARSAGSENKVPFVAAVSLCDDGRPLRIKLTPVSGFTLKAILLWAKDNLVPASAVFSDGLACFGGSHRGGL